MTEPLFERAEDNDPIWGVKKKEMLPRPVVCQKCGGRQIALDRSENPPVWYCIVDGWYDYGPPAPFVPAVDRAGRITKKNFERNR